MSGQRKGLSAKTSREKLVESAEQMQALASLTPVLRHLGKTGREMADILADAPEYVRQAREIAELPKRFNAALGQRGWIAHERMNHEVAKRATELAEAGDSGAAEDLLVESMSPELIRIHLIWLDQVQAFRARRRLLRLALDDYEAGRYHASVPVVLAQLDGVVSDVAGSALFHKTRDVLPKLIVWDSVAATGDGLPALTQLLTQPRHTTSDEPLDLPYRHGILHGRDLGYATKKVAAKVWWTAFAVREWAIKFERGEIEPPPVEPPPSLRQLIDQLAAARKRTKEIEAWRPRPSFAVPRGATFAAGTPEAAVADELESSRDGTAAKVMPWGERRYTAYTMANVVDRAAATTDIRLEVEFADGLVEPYRASAFYRDEKKSPLIRGEPGGAWEVIFRRSRVPPPVRENVGDCDDG